MVNTFEKNLASFLGSQGFHRWIEEVSLSHQFAPLSKAAEMALVVQPEFYKFPTVHHFEVMYVFSMWLGNIQCYTEKKRIVHSQRIKWSIRTVHVLMQNFNEYLILQECHFELQLTYTCNPIDFNWGKNLLLLFSLTNFSLNGCEFSTEPCGTWKDQYLHCSFMISAESLH